MFWSTGLLYVANSALKETSDVEWRFFFLLCIHSYQNLYPSYRVVEGVIQSLLTMAVSKDAITLSEARQIIQELRDRKSVYVIQERVRGLVVVDLDLAVIDTNAARVNALADKFEELTTFDEFTKGIV